MRPFFILIATLIFILNLKAQTSYKINLLTSGTPASFRGLSVINDSVIWISGSNGYVGKSSDGGKTWSFMQVFEYEKAEFRDIEAFDANIAIVMSSTQPAFIIKTTDGGTTWKEVYRDLRTEAFLDGMDFWDTEKGVCFGDPVNNRFLIITTDDSGDSWSLHNPEHSPAAIKDVAAFAASGTSIQCTEKGKFYFATGGAEAVLYRVDLNNNSWEKIPTPIQSGYASSGIFSIKFINENKGFITGGDYTKDKSDTSNFYYTDDAGKTWEKSEINPSGYRSCIEYLSDDKLVVCGTSGVDVAATFNYYWHNISTESFNVIMRAKNGKAVFLAGNDGKISELNW
jgi:photosystem II stability/assembly factor-like uncharacterized protein